MKEGLEKDLDQYADKQLNPEDVVFTRHFFDRMVDPRNNKMISRAEILGFFKRLAKHKKHFLDFLKKYKEFVVTDKRYDINIPFTKTMNQLIAKTVMRKRDFKTSNPVYAFEAAEEKEKLDTTGFSFKDNVSATKSLNRVKGSSLSKEDKIRLINILQSRVNSQFKSADDAQKKASLRSSLKKLDRLLIFLENPPKE